jgi:hypothetical protein
MHTNEERAVRSATNLLACLLSLLAIALAPHAGAVTDEVHGECGTGGMNSAPGAPGERGGDGEDVSAHAQAEADAENRALAYGGCGGRGGDGREGHPVGARGGEGGEAFSALDKHTNSESPAFGRRRCPR